MSYAGEECKTAVPQQPLNDLADNLTEKAMSANDAALAVLGRLFPSRSDNTQSCEKQSSPSCLEERLNRTNRTMVDLLDKLETILSRV